MIRAFVDASVLYAAADSATGASREIIRLGLRGRVGLVISDLVVEEAERNLAKNAPAAVPYLKLFLDVAEFEVVTPTKNQVLRAAAYTAAKDAPIVAGAKRAKVHYLVTLDRKHLLKNAEAIAANVGVEVVPPSVLLQAIRKGGEDV